MSKHRTHTPDKVSYSAPPPHALFLHLLYFWEVLVFQSVFDWCVFLCSCRGGSACCHHHSLSAECPAGPEGRVSLHSDWEPNPCHRMDRYEQLEFPFKQLLVHILLSYSHSFCTKAIFCYHLAYFVNLLKWCKVTKVLTRIWNIASMLIMSSVTGCNCDCYRRSREQNESQSCDKRWCIDLHSSGLNWWGRIRLQGPEHSWGAHSTGFSVHPKYAICLCVCVWTCIIHMCCGDIHLFI